MAIAATLVLLAACSSSSSDSGATTTAATTSTSASSTTTDAAATTTEGSAGTTTAPTSAAPTTTAATGTTAAPSTTAPCVVRGNPLPDSSSDPLLMSSLIGADIGVGDHPCFERVVIELQGTGDFPGWAVEYVDGPVRLGESDDFVEIEGSHTLLLRMGMWMQTMEGDGYAGPTQIFPTTVDHILELRMTENWEGMTIWAIGVDDEYSFTTDVLSSPPRLVIDIQVAES